MSRVKVNRLCNVVTGEHSTAYVRHDGSCAPQITIPALRLRLDIDEARALAADLAEAVQFAAGLEVPR